MIRVARPATAPAVLLAQGVTATQADCAAHNRNERAFVFDAEVYGHQEVKQALVGMNHSKCCYCESRVTHVSPGTTDHYRPKTASQQAPGTPLLRPGYYWLAYEWKNLLFLCDHCNKYHKRNLFPLADPSARARSHHDDISKEQPLLIDPCSEDPTALIGFREEYAFAVDDNVRGRTTIDVLGINRRRALVERRRERLEVFRTLRGLCALAPGSAEAVDAHELISESNSDSGEYAAMLRAALTNT